MIELKEGSGEMTTQLVNVESGEYIVGHVLGLLDCISLQGDDSGMKLENLKKLVKTTIYSQLNGFQMMFLKNDFDKFYRDSLIVVN